MRASSSASAERRASRSASKRARSCVAACGREGGEDERASEGRRGRGEERSESVFERARGRGRTEREEEEREGPRRTSILPRISSFLTRILAMSASSSSGVFFSCTRRARTSVSAALNTLIDLCAARTRRSARVRSRGTERERTATHLFGPATREPRVALLLALAVLGAPLLPPRAFGVELLWAQPSLVSAPPSLRARRRRE